MNAHNLNEENLYAPIPGNIPDPVADTKVAPYKFIGLLKMTFPNGKKYFGTGTVIAKSNENDSHYVLTCAHNLYDSEDGGKATKIEFVRAYNDPDKPFPSIEAVSWKYPDGYPAVSVSKHHEKILLLENKIDLLQKDINLDYGIVKLASKVNSVDGFPGLIVKTTEELKNLAVQINGYGWLDEKMSSAKGPIKEVGDKYLRYPISTRVGASGSAITKGNSKEIVGIHTRGYDDKLNQGVRITQTVKDEFLGWMNE